MLAQRLPTFCRLSLHPCPAHAKALGCSRPPCQSLPPSLACPAHVVGQVRVSLIREQQLRQRQARLPRHRRTLECGTACLITVVWVRQPRRQERPQKLGRALPHRPGGGALGRGCRRGDENRQVLRWSVGAGVLRSWLMPSLPACLLPSLLGTCLEAASTDQSSSAPAGRSSPGLPRTLARRRRRRRPARAGGAARAGLAGWGGASSVQSGSRVSRRSSAGGRVETAACWWRHALRCATPRLSDAADLRAADVPARRQAQTLEVVPPARLATARSASTLPSARALPQLPALRCSPLLPLLL